MYLVIIIDWTSRMIVGHTYSNTLHSGFVIEAIRGAIKKHGKPVIINSDQGAQFTSEEYTGFLKREEIKISINGRGGATDNAITERFIRSLKQERLHLVEFDDGFQLRKIIADYIANFNWVRPHQSLNYQTPGRVYTNTVTYQHAG